MGSIEVNNEICVQCTGCVAVCPVMALEYIGGKITPNEKCIDCNICVQFCPVGALKVPGKDGPGKGGSRNGSKV